MKWVRCLKHILQHDPSEKPKKFSYFCWFYLSHEQYQYGVASLWPGCSTVAGAELHYICMKSTYYENEVGGRPQTYPTAWQPSDSPTYADLPLADISMGLHPYDL